VRQEDRTKKRGRTHEQSILGFSYRHVDFIYSETESRRNVPHRHQASQIFPTVTPRSHTHLHARDHRFGLGQRFFPRICQTPTHFCLLDEDGVASFGAYQHIWRSAVYDRVRPHRGLWWKPGWSITNGAWRERTNLGRNGLGINISGMISCKVPMARTSTVTGMAANRYLWICQIQWDDNKTATYPCSDSLTSFVPQQIFYSFQ